MPTKKAVRSKKTKTRAVPTATRKPAAKKAATRAAKTAAKPKVKARPAPKTAAAVGDKYRQSGAPWWKQFL